MHSILVGEWGDGCVDCRLVRWTIDYTTRLLKTTNSVAVATEAYRHPFPQIQGAASINNKYFLSQSTKGEKWGSIETWDQTSKKGRTFSQALPFGPEDFSYRPDKNELWTLAEQPSEDGDLVGRQVIAVDPKKL